MDVSGVNCLLAKANVLRLGTSTDVILSSTQSYERDAEASEELRRELENFGLPPKEARVLIHLSRYGPLKAPEVAQALSIHKTETYHVLTDLQNKGLVVATFEYPMKFAAVSFDKALSVLIEQERKRLMEFERRKHELCRLWKSLPNCLQEREGSFPNHWRQESSLLENERNESDG